MNIHRLCIAAAQAAAYVAIAGCGGGAGEEPAAAESAGNREKALGASTTTWTKIATEGQSFSVSGKQTVRYGAGSKWVKKSVTDTGECTSAFFGKDPARGVVKECDVQMSTTTSVPPAPAPAPAPAPTPSTDTWTKIAAEGDSFTVSGTQTVRYGAGSSWVQASVTSSGQCTNAFFGTDPAYGVVKECDVLASSSASYSATLSWTAPSSTTDGQTLSDLSGFQISYGTSASNLSSSTTVAASATSATIGGLAAGTWYFAVTTLSASGVTSAPSTPVSRILP